MVTDLQHTVFISYARDDSPKARRIADELTQLGFRVKTPMEIPPGSDWVTTLSKSIEAADSVVVLVSSPSIWQNQEISYALDRRGVDVIPVLLNPGEISGPLASRAVVDMSRKETSIDDLARRIAIGHSLDLLSMPPLVLEKLVGDLFETEGFDVTRASSAGDVGYDLIVSSPGNDAIPPKEYVVQVKAYHNGRVSVAALHRIAQTAIQKNSNLNSMVVTNAQLTSVAAETLRDLSATPGTPELQVVDGVQLKNLLLKHPELAIKYSRPLEERW